MYEDGFRTAVLESKAESKALKDLITFAEEYARSKDPIDCCPLQSCPPGESIRT